LVVPKALNSIGLPSRRLGKNMEKKRPTGVTILAVLEILSGLFMLLAGLAFGILGAAFMGGEGMMGVLGPFMGAVGLLFVVLGLVAFVLAYGLWKGLGWAWTIALILAVIGIIAGLVSLLTGGFQNVLTLIIQLIIVYYLTRPHVKAFFGK